MCTSLWNILIILINNCVFVHICGVVSLWKSSGIYECSIILSFWCVNWNIPQEVVHSNPPLIGWAHTQNDHCNCCSQSVHDSALIPPWSSLSLIEATTCGLSATKQTVKPLSKFAQTQIRYLLPLLQATLCCGLYFQDLFTNRAIDLITNHDADTPMFMYLSHAAPHTPLQVSKCGICTWWRHHM